MEPRSGSRRPDVRRSWWSFATGTAVAAVLAAVVAYELLLPGPRGTSAIEAVKLHLFVAAVAATAGATATNVLRLGTGPGTKSMALLLGTATGGGAAILLAVATGNGPDEGDGFFWLTVASLGVSLVAAGVATYVATRLRRA